MTETPKHPKSSFSTVFYNRVRRAAKDNGSPTSARGVVLFKVDAKTTDQTDPSKAKYYSMPNVGNAFVVTDDQWDRILNILSEDRAISTGFR